MKTEIRTSNVSLSRSLHDHIVRKLEPLGRRFDERVDAVIVRLTDVNGPRGGVDKRCRVLVRRTARPSFVVEAFSADAYEAISQAVARADERLDRLTTRRCPVRHSMRRRPRSAVRSRRVARREEAYEAM
jgi:ribosome-associated translation inhibitor RaiA